MASESGGGGGGEQCARSDASVTFQFECPEATGSVRTIPILAHLPKQFLRDVPESLLAKLATDEWKSDEDAGSPANPIVTHPLDSPCKDAWLRMAGTDGGNFVRMIHDQYAYLAAIHSDKKKKDSPVAQPERVDRPRPQLPPGVELEDAIDVLYYYGLIRPQDDPGSLVVPNEGGNVAVYLRARLFLRQMDQVSKAKDFILKALEENPKRSTLFVFVERGDEEGIIQRYNEDRKFTLVKERIFDDNSNDWLCEARFRQCLTDDLQEDGLEAEFLNRMDLVTLIMDEQGLLYRSRPVERDMCRIACKPCRDYSEESVIGYDFDLDQDRYVLKVTIPRAPKKPRID